VARTPKYLDADRTQVNPEWLEQRETAIEELYADPTAYGLEPGEIDVYLPRIDGKAIGPDGAWILVLTEPLTELREKFRVPLLSMWRARPRTMGSAARSFIVDGHRLTLRPQQAVITTPAGELNLWAYEYAVPSDPVRLACDPLTRLHALGGDAVLDPEQMFYLTSRGIPEHQARRMLFAQIAATDFCYATFPEEVTSALAGVGTTTLAPRGLERNQP